MSYYGPSTPSRHRSRSFAMPPAVVPSYPYPTTPYSGYNTLAPSYYDSPGYNSVQPFYVAPSISGRSRSHSRSRHAHGHGHGHTRHRSQSRHRHHGHRRSQSTNSHKQHRPNQHVRFSMSRPERLAQFFFDDFSIVLTAIILALLIPASHTTPQPLESASSVSLALGTATVMLISKVVLSTIAGGPCTNIRIRVEVTELPSGFRHG